MTILVKNQYIIYMKKPIKIDMTQMKPLQVLKVFDILASIRKNLNKKGLDIKIRNLINNK